MKIRTWRKQLDESAIVPISKVTVGTTRAGVIYTVFEDGNVETGTTVAEILFTGADEIVLLRDSLSQLLEKLPVKPNPTFTVKIDD